MVQSMPVLVAPDAFGGALRAPVVAAAIGRGLERAGCVPPELCPVAGGGPGTVEVLLPALGGETAGARVVDASGREVAAAFGLVDGGATAIVEAAQLVAGERSTRGVGELVAGERSTRGVGELVAGERSTRGVGELVAAAIDAGAEVVVVACGGAAGGAGGAVEAIERGGGLRGATLVALYEGRPPGAADGLAAGRAARPGGADGLAAGLVARLGARLVPGAAFVLEELGFDARMRAARAVVTGEARLDAGTLDGRVAGEIAVRARQTGVPCHAVVAVDALTRFDARILDLQAIVEASTIAQLEAAGERLARCI
jgi:glycerate kinase